ncbi:hypothetical protein [Puniceibacterium sediminis]|uniref:Cold shock protein, CspA family n=1 Tax=Puniceibacterium sediminis TaxID=1608407 RepID=A0A238W8B0_9RHOB|nr:hypothetical protein [Puniceibacterium sediminis]SNR42748.1 hypothetical protein SAMN06265370_104251 [Puniceibacterium sediminis]
MSSSNMFGVVLWTDTAEKKAVIWCEDHGNLAFYSGEDHSAVEGVSLDAGDLIQFDMNEESNLRLARNPQLVGQSQYVGIAQSLRTDGGRAKDKTVTNASNIIQMESFLERRKASV